MGDGHGLAAESERSDIMIPEFIFLQDEAEMRARERHMPEPKVADDARRDETAVPSHSAALHRLVHWLGGAQTGQG
jgi:hypothetical protein